MKTARHLTLAMAASVLCFSVSAQAATRSAAAVPAANPAQLSELARVSAPTAGESGIEGEGGILLALLVAAAVIAGIVVAGSGNDSPG